ncbi:hypothetical protein K493DRAFT_314351 [Basidiobolus meristosporus CBS 931.73]|uniref:Mid2 domain-containing protein n=1 Tax=Basidiobolus meristosporus CBS 931.73 TaxID=1314790 RepID=A0A1Y1YFX6_9FUNG|nr:hypothetical protein K493DRAFT_314351 [Basidiobolus meristosporus CBS 931.73]|eukprot:ORX96783.1 hypothetical protein K493DRAFT_314351 [Basidiobolus meristosporus CBS 931.73]
MHTTNLLGKILFILFQITSTFSQAPSSPANVTIGPDDVSKLTGPCGPTVYCLPEKGENWVVNKEYFVRWWNKYPTFLAQGLVEIKLYEASSPPNLVKQWDNITNDIGFFTVKYYPPQLPIFPIDPTREPNSTIRRECYFVIFAPGSDESIAGKGDNFFIDDYNPPASVSVPSPGPSKPETAAAKPTGNNDISIPHAERRGDNQESGISAGAIIGITLGAVAFVTIVALALFFIHRRKKNRANRVTEVNHGEKPRALPPSQYIPRPATSGTLRSTSSESEVDSISPLSASNSGTRRSSLRLTVKDAQILAHTYRAMLSNQGGSSNGEDTLQNNPRGLYSDELLKRELAAEGRGVKNVSTSPAIVVVNSDEMGRKSMTADHSEHEEA